MYTISSPFSNADESTYKHFTSQICAYLYNRKKAVAKIILFKCCLYIHVHVCSHITFFMGRKISSR